MKKFLLFLTLSLIICQSGYSESWTYKQNETYFSNGLYYSHFKPRYAQWTTDGGESFKIKNNHKRIAHILDWHFGLRDDLNLFAKLDLGYEKEQLYVQVDNPNSAPRKQFFTINLDYSRINSDFGLRKQLYKDDQQVLTNRWSFSLGDLIVYDRGSYQLSRNNAIETRLQYGQKFQQEYSWSKYFQGYKSQNFYHFFEWELGLRYYLEPKHFEVPFDVKFGFKFGSNWGGDIALYNRFNSFYHEQIPIKGHIINDHVKAFANLNDEDQDKIMLSIQRLSSYEGCNNYHKLGYKLNYFITDSHTIGLEGLTNIFASNAFSNSIIMLKYSIYM